MSWIATLEEYNYKHRKKPAGGDEVEEAEKATLKELRSLYKQKQLDEQAAKAKEKEEEEEKQHRPAVEGLAIPRFFFKPPKSNDAKHKIRKEARTRFLERKAQNLMTEVELDELWQIILLNQSPPKTSQQRINYQAFFNIRDQAPPSARHYFTSQLYVRFPRDQYGRISSRALFGYIMKKVNLTRIRISLTCYDEHGFGYLREQDLENYVFEQIPLLPQLQGLDRDFYPYYVFTAVRYFLFVLDPQRKGKVSITDLVHSELIQDFNQLRLPAGMPASPDMSTPAARKRKAWFAGQNALDVYEKYLALDTDHNGMLRKSEFAQYNRGSLTPTFVDRLFQEYRMYDSKESGELEMDYKTFLDFVLAMEFKAIPQAIRYFWKILDIKHQGYLTVFELNTFFRDVARQMHKNGYDRFNAADVIANEIFDMVRPAIQYRITLDDLLNCRCGSTIISILTDVTGFWKYDNRELLLSE